MINRQPKFRSVAWPGLRLDAGQPGPAISDVSPNRIVGWRPHMCWSCRLGPRSGCHPPLCAPAVRGGCPCHCLSAAGWVSVPWWGGAYAELAGTVEPWLLWTDRGSSPRWCDRRSSHAADAVAVVSGNDGRRDCAGRVQLGRCVPVIPDPGVLRRLLPVTDDGEQTGTDVGPVWRQPSGDMPAGVAASLLRCSLAGYRS